HSIGIRHVGEHVAVRSVPGYGEPDVLEHGKVLCILLARAVASGLLFVVQGTRLLGSAGCGTYDQIAMPIESLRASHAHLGPLRKLARAPSERVSRKLADTSPSRKLGSS